MKYCLQAWPWVAQHMFNCQSLSTCCRMALLLTLWPFEARTKSVPTLWPPTLLLRPRSVPGQHLMKAVFQSLTSLNRKTCLIWAHMIVWMAVSSTLPAPDQWTKARSDRNQSVLECFRAVKGNRRRSYLEERRAYRRFPTQFPTQTLGIQQTVVMRQMRRGRENEQGVHPLLQAGWRVEPAVEGIVSRYSLTVSRVVVCEQT